MLFKVTITKIIEWECEPFGDDGDKKADVTAEIVDALLEDLPELVDKATWEITEVTE